MYGGSSDILLYGCQVAAADAGTEFINKLSQITGAKIAVFQSDIPFFAGLIV
jgi:hypothetical protein